VMISVHLQFLELPAVAISGDGFKVPQSAVVWLVDARCPVLGEWARSLLPTRSRSKERRTIRGLEYAGGEAWDKLGIAINVTRI